MKYGMRKTLTAKEIQVLELKAGGATTEAVGLMLKASKRTIDTRLRSIYKKLGVYNLQQALLESGMVETR